MLPTEHLTMASQLGLSFYASVKQRRGGCWEKVLTSASLKAAFERATAEEAFERAVFVQTQAGGIMYWTSRHPSTFNTEALTQALHEHTKGSA
jgi:hypothetical protein